MNKILGRESTEEELEYLKFEEKVQSGLVEADTPTGPRITFIYFDLHGRGLQCRMLFHYCGVDFNDVRINFEQHAQMKKKK